MGGAVAFPWPSCLPAGAEDPFGCDPGLHHFPAHAARRSTGGRPAADAVAGRKGTVLCCAVPHPPDHALSCPASRNQLYTIIVLSSWDESHCAPSVRTLMAYKATMKSTRILPWVHHQPTISPRRLVLVQVERIVETWDMGECPTSCPLLPLTHAILPVLLPKFCMNLGACLKTLTWLLLRHTLARSSPCRVRTTQESAGRKRPCGISPCTGFGLAPLPRLFSSHMLQPII